MDTLIGALTALMALLIVAVSFGALALVTTGGALPLLPRRQSRRSAATATIDTARLTVSPGAATTITPLPDFFTAEPVTGDPSSDELQVLSGADSNVTDRNDRAERDLTPETTVPNR